MRIPPHLADEDLVTTYHATAARYPNVFAASRDILRECLGRGFEFIGNDVLGETWRDREFIRIVDCLVRARPLGPIALLFSAFLTAQSRFAAKDCMLPCHEDGLTALFKRRLEDAIWWSNEDLGRKNRETYMPAIFAADLNIRGREWRTGADIAFILGMTDQAGAQCYVVHCFQAKRADQSQDGKVDIRRGYDRAEGKDGGDQLRRLSRLAKLGCHSSYLFYNNDVRSIIPQPVAPLVKGIGHVLKHGEGALDVRLDSDCCDLASYILRSTTDAVVGGSCLTAEELMHAIDALVGEEISHVVALGTDRTAYDNILSYARRLDLVNVHQARSLDTRTINFDLVAVASAVDWQVETEDAEAVLKMKFSPSGM